MQVTNAIEDYLAEHTLRLAPRTVRWYEQKLDTWSHSLEPMDLRELTPTHINKYLATRTHLKATTRRGDAQAIRTFLSWCIEVGYLPSFPLKRIQMPANATPVIGVFTQQHIQLLLNVCNQEESATMVARDRCLILFLLDTGLRAQELCSLTLDKLDTAHRTATVWGKGNKERLVGYGEETANRLTRYLRRYRYAQHGVENVFTNRNGYPLTPSGLDQILYRLDSWANLVGVRVSAHTFRHTFAVNYLMLGGDMYSLSRLLGHASVTTTQRYVQAATDSQILHQRPSVVDTLSGLRYNTDNPSHTPRSHHGG